MTEPELLLALDQGTSSSRAIVFDARARIRGLGQVELPATYPRPGWVEQDPLEILETQVAAAREALAAAGAEASAIGALGITNQRETTVAWDVAGTPLSPAIVWQDRRTADRCAELQAAGVESPVRERTGLLLDPYFSATKMAWLLDAIPDGRDRAAAGDIRLGTVDSWLVDRLTGGHVFATDPSNASRTLLFDLHDRGWSTSLGETFGVPLAALPEIRSSDGDFGEVDAAWLGAPIPIRGILGDQQAALFGQGCFALGEAKNTYGTGCFLLMTTGADVPAPPPGLLATLGWTLGSQGTSYALEGSVFVAGAAVRWLRDALGMIPDAASVEALAASVPDAGGVTVVPAFAGLGAPYWDPDARGAVLGITAGTSAAHFARATLEAIAQQTVDLVEALEAGGAPRLRTLRADGGAAGNDLLLQLQADLLGRPVVRSSIAETTALGAALVAGLATGLWSSLDELSGLNPPARMFEPQATESWRRTMRDRWRDAVARIRSGSGSAS
ncbi:MAG TPA: glycerol kinase GlpK [Candidatus Limnocylindrales bacterium]